MFLLHNSYEKKILLKILKIHNKALIFFKMKNIKSLTWAPHVLAMFISSCSTINPLVTASVASWFPLHSSNPDTPTAGHRGWWQWNCSTAGASNGTGQARADCTFSFRFWPPFVISRRQLAPLPGKSWKSLAPVLVGVLDVVIEYRIPLKRFRVH